ncbi:hypothetical protein [Candidatus Hodgkinia cicadicola]|uniref:hypothetical protein n=1 Tax=Candidatus Hodgkinia cicadicola TaxID=573658 RepID=UPI001788CBCB
MLKQTETQRWSTKYSLNTFTSIPEPRYNNHMLDIIYITIKHVTNNNTDVCLL